MRAPDWELLLVLHNFHIFNYYTFVYTYATKHIFVVIN